MIVEKSFDVIRRVHLTMSFMAIVVAVLQSGPCVAQECPKAGSPIKQVTDTISEFQKNGRSPAGADCAYEWTRNVDFDPAAQQAQLLKALFRAAADIQRNAADQRLGPDDLEQRQLFLQHEVDLRRKFLKGILDAKATPEVLADYQSDIVKHISYLASALALLDKYEDVANELGDKPPIYVDEEAVKVWLQAVWSCAQWDGKKGDLCEAGTRQKCKDSVSTFLESLDGMGSRTFPPKTNVDLRSLKKLTAINGCLQ